ncbi:hypothetical protein [Acinetobacter baumannii]
MKPEQFIREQGLDKAREEFEKKLKCQDLLSELTFCEKTSSYEGDILPTNLATINGAYWAWVKRQAEMDEQQAKVEELQKRVDDIERKLQIKTRHCEFYEQSRKGHRSLAIHRKKQINSALEQIEKLYSRAESDYQKDRNPYYDGMLSALDLAEQAIRGELEEQALKGEG